MNRRSFLTGLAASPLVFLAPIGPNLAHGGYIGRSTKSTYVGERVHVDRWKGIFDPRKDDYFEIKSRMSINVKETVRAEIMDAGPMIAQIARK